ncbi:hypothetical protein E3U55_03075 [Filobacillus milosensis]|uniref:Competence protein ComG n=1 Tax=Filobacillus milosensis TaxID=94137 RepID=A0A4Y8IUC5_9BACI|nr:hypothetical protein [Filobacillus milosensis]TFB23809.1 hypothetical protein E3U55_03075 [Filobacillus milosensis]
MNIRRHMFIKLFISNEKGAVFPYVLIVMIILSSFLLTLYELEQYQLEQTKMLEEQQSLQNIIQIAIHDFDAKQEELLISKDVQLIEFIYQTGQACIEYSLIDDNTIKLKLSITTNNYKRDRPFIYSTKIMYKNDDNLL